MRSRYLPEVGRWEDKPVVGLIICEDSGNKADLDLGLRPDSLLLPSSRHLSWYLETTGLVIPLWVDRADSGYRYLGTWDVGVSLNDSGYSPLKT